MDVVLTLSDVHPRDRLAYWYDVACKVFVDHECRVTTPAQFDVTMQHMALSDLGVVNIESLGLGFAEDPAHHREWRGRRILPLPAARRRRHLESGWSRSSH